MVIATLDTQPDPPAVNPSSALSKVLQPHDCCCDAATLRCDSLDISHPLPVNLVAADAYEPRIPIDRLDLTVQGADPSPPLALHGEPSLQS